MEIIQESDDSMKKEIIEKQTYSGGNQVKNYEYELRCKELFKRYNFWNIVPGENIKEILIGLMSIAEVCYNKIPGDVRMQYTVSMYENYMREKGIVMDNHGRILLRTLAQELFNNNKKKLKKYYYELFELGVKCLKMIL